TVAWLAFGVAIAILGISALSQLDPDRGLVQRVLDGVISSIATVLIVFSLVFTGTVVTWLAFGLALGFVAVAVAGMTLHEIETWLSTRQSEEVRHLSTARNPVEAEPQVPATFSQAA
ncbi:MAG TPA: hypothetical protein VMS00_05570, partial [Acidimicrobiales bacterium]|nr:hypothetical protein [Acidimicrobiales bacterium]